MNEELVATPEEDAEAQRIALEAQQAERDAELLAAAKELHYQAGGE